MHANDTTKYVRVGLQKHHHRNRKALTGEKLDDIVINFDVDTQ
jgi:hypothetical protein